MAKVTPVYSWREIVPLRGADKLEAQKVGTIIAGLKSNDKPTELWQAARRPDHYLHGCYEWNPRKAAEAHWRDTSLRIIRCLYVVSEDEEPAPAFISLRYDGHGPRDFFQPDDIAGNKFLELETIRSAMRDLDAFKRRYRMLTDICQIISVAESKLSARINPHDDAG